MRNEDDRVKVSLQMMATGLAALAAAVTFGKVVFEPMFLEASRVQTLLILDSYDKQLRESMGKDVKYIRDAVDKIEVGVNHRLDRIEARLEK